MTATLTVQPVSVGCETPGVRVQCRPGSRVVVSLSRGGPLPPVGHIEAALRSGAILQWTIAVDLSPGEVVAVLGLSGYDLPPGASVDLVARLVLAGCDLVEPGWVSAAALVAGRVDAGTATSEDRAEHAEVWSDPGRYLRCTTAVAALVEGLR